jgi:hypothetical protein
MRKGLVLLVMGVLFFPGGSGAEQMQQPPAKQEQSRPLAPEFAKGVISPILSILYFPLKFSVGTVGAVAGSVSGWMTGGNIRAAEGIWRPMTGGTYFVTPQVMGGERPFLPFDGGEYAQWPAHASPSESPYQQP